MLAAPEVRAEQVTQLLLGETGRVGDERGEWLGLRLDRDGYEGWVHRGYLRRIDSAAEAEWRETALGWSDGAQVTIGRQRVPLPLGARVALEAGHVTLPDGRIGRVTTGGVRLLTAVAAEAHGMPVERWALGWFEGSPYQWGGRTPWGVDCSGLVQTAFAAARGVMLPRDSSRQAEIGEPVAPDAVAPGDLLFFHGDDPSRITHVAFAGPDDTLIHSTIACGGVLIEPRGPGARAEPLMRRVVAIRRIPSA